MLLADTAAGLGPRGRDRAKLNDHEGNITKADDVEDVMSVRFALPDAARQEVAALIGWANA